ncbi:hypothetical protein GDO81_021879 [Engystomops pustulosus]|uniref:Uncharacterized protein n=1 Tax=Engystomops pustulosus TaxID=76066 RepID=A0AAV6ZBN3_ENGPU|nr:hypothetical protein GDO81_021879 [Engystomops pustulosus]
MSNPISVKWTPSGSNIPRLSPSNSLCLTTTPPLSRTKRDTLVFNNLLLLSMPAPSLAPSQIALGMISDHTRTKREKKEENLSKSDWINGINSPKRTVHKSLPPRCKTSIEGDSE